MDIVDPKKVIRTRPHRLRKNLHIKTAARKEYEQRFPAISLRVNSNIKMRFLLDAKRAGMTERQYLEHLVQGASFAIDAELKKSYDSGYRDGDQAGFERGQKTALIENKDKIVQSTRQLTVEEAALDFPCARCGRAVPILRNSIAHHDCIQYLVYRGHICEACALRSRLVSLSEPPTAPRPSFWPANYAWPPQPRQNPP